MDEDKRAALDIALGRIEKDYGKGAVMRLGEMQHQLNSDAIPTGSLALDVALGVGGIPRGRVTEIFGAESAGKSTLAIHIMAEIHPDCAFSAAAKMDFRQRKIEYVEIDISVQKDKIPDLLALSNGERLTPVVVENGVVTLGFKGGS